MTTRSKQLAWGLNAVANTTTAVYTCPSGHRTIVKSAVFYNNDAAAKNFICFIGNGAATVYGHIMGTTSVAAGASFRVTAWEVMEAGQILYVFYSGAIGKGDWIISGAELSV